MDEWMDGSLECFRIDLSFFFTHNPYIDLDKVIFITYIY